MNTQLKLLGKQINMAPRLHRRWLVVAMYAVFAVLITAWFSDYAPRFAAWCLIGAVGLQLVLLHLVGQPSEATDERESHRWDQARSRAYPWLGYCLLFALGTTQLHTKVNEALHPTLFATFQQLPYSLLMAAGVLYVTLPQTILLWTEPDLEEAR